VLTVARSETTGEGGTAPGAVEVSALPSLLTAKQVAIKLEIRPKRVYEILGHLAISLAPRTLRWDPVDIEVFIKERRGRVT
jgi:hypothetical protein